MELKEVIEQYVKETYYGQPEVVAHLLCVSDQILINILNDIESEAAQFRDLRSTLLSSGTAKRCSVPL